MIVTGLVGTYPVGGVAWDYLQYVQGFHALGCEVYYLEDTGAWLYDPRAQTFTDDASASARFVGEALTRLEPALGRRWAMRGPDGTYHGLDEAAVAAAQKARFKPYTENGRPTAGWARIPFPFELEK